MPYNRNSQLPASVKNAIGSGRGLTMFRRVVNSQLKAGKPESVAFASAWSALKNAGYKRNKESVWVKKAYGATPLYMYRPVMNAENIVEWAKSQGIEETLDPEDMHVTVVYSRQPFSAEYSKMADTGEPARYGNSVVRGGKRSCMRLGKEGEALVLKFECGDLMYEHEEFKRIGASWDHDEYKPHITLSYKAEDIDESKMEPYSGDIVLGNLMVEKIVDDWEERIVHKSDDTFTPPKSAQNNAKKVLRWKEEHGDEVKGMTAVGWTRARQLASGKPISRDIVARMSSFNRHRKNSKVDPDYTDTPWKDAGHVAWLGWGGTTGVEWAMDKMKTLSKRKVNDDIFTTKEEATARSYEMYGMEPGCHCMEIEGQMMYRPGLNKEAYETYYAMENNQDGSEREGLLSEAVRAILNSVMEMSDMRKRVSMNAEILKSDTERRIVWGWASVSTDDGELVYDSQGDSITPDEMSKMADEFMASVRTAKVMHSGKRTGEILHSFPVTKELADAFGLEMKREGWIIGMKVHDDDTWAAVKSGDFPAFSIGGWGERRAL